MSVFLVDGRAPSSDGEQRPSITPTAFRFWQLLSPFRGQRGGPAASVVDPRSELQRDVPLRLAPVPAEGDCLDVLARHREVALAPEELLSGGEVHRPLVRLAGARLRLLVDPGHPWGAVTHAGRLEGAPVSPGAPWALTWHDLPSQAPAGRGGGRDRPRRDRHGHHRHRGPLAALQLLHQHPGH